MTIEISIAACSAVIGACIGSFLNVVVYRLPKGEFFSSARSRCAACGHTIRWHDLFPVLSWLFLRGKCRDCGAVISPRYPLVELFCAALAPFCFWRFGYDWMAPLAFCACAVLLAVALIDLGTMEIPDALVVALIPFAVLSVRARPEVSLLSRATGLIAVSLPMLLLALLIKGAFGGGDVKLMAVCGFLLGWRNTLLAFFIALLLGGGAAIVLLATKKRGKGAHIPFGPALCAGVAAAVFYGDEIIRFYLGLYGM